MQLHSAEQNSALRIPTFSLYLKLPDFFRESLCTILILPRQVVDFCTALFICCTPAAHLLQAARIVSEKSYEFGSLPKFAVVKLVVEFVYPSPSYATC